MRYLISLLLIIQTTSLAASNVSNICAPNPNTPSSLTALKKSTKFPDILGWRTADNLCGGYFFEPQTIRDHPNPKPIDEETSTITATGQSTFRQKGPTTLRGDVTLIQPGREAKADTVVLRRNEQTGKINHMDLYGDISFRETGKLLVGKEAHINVADNTWNVSDGLYQVERPSIEGIQQGWGMVNCAVKKSADILELDNATYTTCAPMQTWWHLKAQHITLNQETGRGVATHSRLYAGKIPIFYAPYFNFPIDKRRQTGFLYPTAAYNRESGAIVGIPYYLNLAPNYDATITLTPMTRRGLQMTGLVRYLTEKSDGFIQASTLPNDQEFARFKTWALGNYPPTLYNQPFLNNLENSSNTRNALVFHHDTEFNPHWSSSLEANWVSDDYYYQDFGIGPVNLNRDQLLNQAALQYQSDHWQFLSKLQGFQTLHVITNTFVANQYQRLPQLNLDGNFPNEAYGLNYGLSSEWVNFQHEGDFLTGEPYPTGIRFHLSPQVSRPYLSSAGFFIPTLAVDMTSYSVSNNAIVNTLRNPPIVIPTTPSGLNTTRTLPILSLDSGLYFERTQRLMGKTYKQTLEPRAFYLYVPPTAQNHIPVFDTTLPTFDYNQLFRTNRFIGYDRIGDANQVSLGVTSRFLDDYTGAEKIDLSLGGIYYFRPYTTCLYPDCSGDENVGQQVSPIAGRINIHPNPQWTVRGSTAWDPNQGQVQNAEASVFYRPLPQHIFKVGYNYVQEGDPEPGTPLLNNNANNLQRINLGMAWQFKKNWSLLADWNYNVSHRHPQNYLYGIEYNNCCVAIRVVANRTFLSQDVNDAKFYRNNIYVQFLFKGLGTIGTGAAGDMLSSALPGYTDIFRGNAR